MSKDFATRLVEIMEDSSARREAKKKEWIAARRGIKKVFDEAAAVIKEGSESKELNGNRSILSRGDDKLEFIYEGSSHKVTRTSTREDGQREYEPSALTMGAIETEVEEFVRAIFS